MAPPPSPLDHPAVGRRVFYPRPTTAVPTHLVNTGTARLGCHVRQTFPSAGTVVYFHGNGELASESDAFCGDLFTQARVNVCFVEYRGYGASDGQAALVAMLGDGAKVVEALGLAPERVVAFGRSLGSLYAIELAHRFPRLGGLILESAIAAIPDLWPLDREAEEIGCGAAALNREIATHFDHRVKLGGYTGPQLVLHAAGDRHLDTSHAERLHAWGGGTEKRLVVFPHGNHNSIFMANFPAYSTAVWTFLRDIGMTALPGGTRQA